jgi:centrin-1
MISISRAKYAMLDVLKMNISKNEIRIIANENGCISWDDFSNFSSVKLRQKQKATYAFQLFDKDEKGLLCLEDLARIADDLGESYTEQDLEEMINEVDHSGEGFINKEDFFKLIRKLSL